MMIAVLLQSTGYYGLLLSLPVPMHTGHHIYRSAATDIAAGLCAYEKGGPALTDITEEIVAISSFRIAALLLANAGELVINHPLVLKTGH